MTQTTDDSVNSCGGSTESTTSTCTFIASMDDRGSMEEEKGTATAAGESCSDGEQDLEAAAAASPKMATKVTMEQQDPHQCVAEPTRGAKEIEAQSEEETSVTGPTENDNSNNNNNNNSDTKDPIPDVAKLDEVKGLESVEIMDNSASPTESSQLSKVPMCAVCAEPCICYCKSCKKVCYCSKEHQKKHWKQHRPECYPVIVQVNSVFGSHLVVTRDIKRGEVILRERPLVSCPFLGYGYGAKREIVNVEDNGKGFNTCLQSVCLSCNKIIRDHHDETAVSTCSKCGWPICCQDCEKNPTHADQECEIFAEYHVEASAICDKDTQYLCVALLRILLNKKRASSTTNGNDSSDHHHQNDHGANNSFTSSYRSKWTKFMEVVNKQMPMKDGLNSQSEEAKKATARFSDLITKSLGPIIRQEFSISDAEIDQIVRTLRTSSFITDTNGNYINGFVGHPFPMNNNGDLGHHCSGRGGGRHVAICIGQEETGTDADHAKCNVSRFQDKGKFLSLYHLASMLTSNCIPNASWLVQHESLDFCLRASTPIKTGERITITFVDPLLGTWERRERLWQEKYLSCSCLRCSDPTESCTFFSAIKCRENKNEDGKNSNRGSECEGYILPTDPLAVTYTLWDSCRTSCFPPFDAATQEEKAKNDSCCRDYYYNLLRSDENSIPEQEPASHVFSSCSEEKGMVAEWKCNVCLKRQPWGFVQNSLLRMKENLYGSGKEISSVTPPPPPTTNSSAVEFQDVCFTATQNFRGGGNNTIPEANANKIIGGEMGVKGRKHDGETRDKIICEGVLENLESRVDKIDNFVRNVAHANHYDVLKMENELLTEISKLFETGQMPFEEMEKWALRMMELCKKGLRVINILCPGLSRERGYLLYFLQQSLVLSLLFKTSRAMRIINSPGDTNNGTNCAGTTVQPAKEILSHEELMKKFQEILLARKEVLEIFAISKENSEEARMLKAVQHDSIEVRVLKNYFKYHQNISH